MSTYTDLHNKIRENVTVDYHNRATPQLVKLLNKNNEYWGTFKGNVVAENVTISGGSFEDVTIANAKLSGGTLVDRLGQEIDLGNLAIDIIKLSGDVQTADDSNKKLYTAVIDNEKLLEDLRDYVDENLSFPTSDILDKTNEISGKVITLSNDVANANTKHASDVEQLQEKIDDTNTRIEDEIVERGIQDTILNGSIECLKKDLHNAYTELNFVDETEKAERIAADEKLFNDLSVQLSSDITTDTEARKHYSINKTNILDKSIQLKDFAVNVVEFIVDGYSILDPNGVIVGKLHHLDSSELADVTKASITIYKSTKSAVIPEVFAGEYDDVEINTDFRDTGFLDYKISLKNINGEIAVEFTGTPLKLYHVYDKNGIIYGSFFNNNTSNDRKEYDLLFRVLAVKDFDRIANRDISFATDNVQFVKDIAGKDFKFEKTGDKIGISTDYLETYYYDLVDDGQKFGRIYANDMISANGQLSTITIKDIAATYEHGNISSTAITLDSANAFVDSLPSFSDDLTIKYDTTDNRVDIGFVNHVYQYLTTEANLMANVSVIPAVVNKTLDDTVPEEIATVSVVVGDLQWGHHNISGTYVLSNAYKAMLSSEPIVIKNAAGNDLSISLAYCKLSNFVDIVNCKYNSHRYFKVHNTASRFDSPATFVDTIVSARLDPLKVDISCANTYNLTISKETTYMPSDKKISLTDISLTVDDLTLHMPEKLENVLKEGIIFIKGISSAKNGWTNVKISDAIAETATILYNDDYVGSSIAMRTNQWNCFKFNQVAQKARDGKDCYEIFNYSVKDVYTYINESITDLSATTRNEITYLSNEVDDKLALSVDNIESEISLSVSNLEDEIALSVGNIENEISLSVSNIEDEISVKYDTIDAKIDEVSSVFDRKIVGGIRFEGTVYTDKGDVHSGSISAMLKFSHKYYTPLTPLVNGFMYLVSGNSLHTITDETGTITLGNGDYIIINNGKLDDDKIKLEDVRISNINKIDSQDDDIYDIIKLSVGNLEDEIYLSANTLSNYIDTLRHDTELSVANIENEIELSVNTLENEIYLSVDTLSSMLKLSSDTLNDKIDTLSGNLSNDIDTLSINLSTDIQLSVANLSSDIKDISVDNEIIHLSVDNISVTIDNYNQTFVAPDNEKFEYHTLSSYDGTQFTEIERKGEGLDIVVDIPDQLLIKDSKTPTIYKLMVENGAIVLRTYLSGTPE